MWKSVKNGENFDYYRGKKAKKREKFHLRMRGKKCKKLQKWGKFWFLQRESGEKKGKILIFTEGKRRKKCVKSAKNGENLTFHRGKKSTKKYKNRKNLVIFWNIFDDSGDILGTFWGFLDTFRWYSGDILSIFRWF